MAKKIGEKCHCCEHTLTVSNFYTLKLRGHRRSTMLLPNSKSLGNGVIGFALLSLFIASAILVRSHDWYTPASDPGYYLGLAGGILMLLLLVYPLKKRVKFLQRMGSTKPWFVFHMICGIVGPLAIIFHSTFRIASQNALVAMVSMLLVAISGIIGRFIYVRIHAGLSDQELTLDELEGSETSESLNLNRDMQWATDVIKELLEFRAEANQQTSSRSAATLKFCKLPFVEWQVRRRCHRWLSVHLDKRATRRSWDATKRALRGRQFDALVAHYTEVVKRRAQYEMYRRLFAWWHILHLPFVWLLAASAVYHVVAVHMY